MKPIESTRVVTSVLGILILVAASSLAGCATYSQSQVPVSDAANTLHVGDEVVITRNDDSTEYLKIDEVSDAGISGSSLTNMFGRDVTVTSDDIAAITLYTKEEKRDGGQAFEALTYLLILWPFFL